MNRYQETAIRNHCRLAVETCRPMFFHEHPSGASVCLTVNTGYE